MDQVTGHSLKFGPVVGIDGHVLARQLVVHDDEDEDEDEDKEEDHHQVQADYFGRRKPDKWTHHHDTENGGPGITYWYMVSHSLQSSHGKLVFVLIHVSRTWYVFQYGRMLAR